jgi:hypothetical protein
MTLSYIEPKTFSIAEPFGGRMTETHPYRVLLALQTDAQLNMWCQFAEQMMPRQKEIHLRGLVTVPSDQSLSEGARPARQWRESFQQIAIEDPMIHDRVQIHVDYQPMRSLLNESRELNIDLLIIQWMGPIETTGGMTTDDILKAALCDVVLVDVKWQPKDGPVLLSLRGGPNISLGFYVAKALAGQSSITLFHAADRQMIAPDLEMLMRSDIKIDRTVTAFSGITEGILQEAQNHKSIVLGARLQLPEKKASTSGPVVRRLYEQTDIPLVLVRAKRAEALEFGSAGISCALSLTSPRRGKSLDTGGSLVCSEYISLE